MFLLLINNTRTKNKVFSVVALGFIALYFYILCETKPAGEEAGIFNPFGPALTFSVEGGFSATMSYLSALGRQLPSFFIVLRYVCQYNLLLTC